MNTLDLEPLAKDVSFRSDMMWVELEDGREIGVPLAYFPRLMKATAKQREKFIISGGGRGLHWESVDEDISVRGLLLGRADISLSKNGRTKRAA